MGMLAAFSLLKEKNPFTTKALAKYHADGDVGREKVAHGGGESYLDICDRYH